MPCGRRLPLCLLQPSWLRAQALLCGVLLAPANHTLTAALRVLGLAQQPGFQNYHRLLNRARWSARQAAQVLLRLLVEAFVPAGPVIVGPDETIEGRRGRKLTARAIYRDAARSSKDCFQKRERLTLDDGGLAGTGALGGPGLVASVFDRALPFGTLRPVRAPGPALQTLTRAGARPHRPSAPWAAPAGAPRGGRLQLRRPGVVGLVRAAGPSRNGDHPLTLGCGPVPTGPRAPARPKRPAAAQRRAVAHLGSALSTRPHPLAGLSTALVRRPAPPAGCNWPPARRCGMARANRPWPSALVLVRDPQKRFEPQALLCTDLKLSARHIVTYFIRRWSMETTFQEARLYLGLEGQRQWNDLATARATPARLALFSLVTLTVQRQPDWQQAFRCSAWYKKARPTFADALARSASCPLAAVRFLALAGRGGQAKTYPCFIRALRGTARLRRLKMAKLELSGHAKLMPH